MTTIRRLILEVVFRDFALINLVIKEIEKMILRRDVVWKYVVQTQFIMTRRQILDNITCLYRHFDICFVDITTYNTTSRGPQTFPYIDLQVDSAMARWRWRDGAIDDGAMVRWRDDDSSMLRWSDGAMVRWRDDGGAMTQ